MTPSDTDVAAVPDVLMTASPSSCAPDSAHRTGRVIEGAPRVVAAEMMRAGRPGIVDVVAVVGVDRCTPRSCCARPADEVRILPEGDDAVVGTAEDGDGTAVVLHATRTRRRRRCSSNASWASPSTPPSSDRYTRGWALSPSPWRAASPSPCTTRWSTVGDRTWSCSWRSTPRGSTTCPPLCRYGAVAGATSVWCRSCWRAPRRGWRWRSPRCATCTPRAAPPTWREGTSAPRRIASARWWPACISPSTAPSGVAGATWGAGPRTSCVSSRRVPSTSSDAPTSRSCSTSCAPSTSPPS